MTDEVVREEKTVRLQAKWYRVHPVLLAVLLAEILVGIGLVVLEPDAFRQCLTEAVASLRIGFVEVEIALVSLSIAAVTTVATRARRELRFNVLWLGGAGRGADRPAGE